MILVTGGTGLVGSHLLRALVESESRPIRATYRSKASLAHTEKVFGYTLNDPAAAMAKIEWVQTDLFDLVSVGEAMEGVQTVFHCAAVVSFQPKDAQSMLEGNPKITEILIDAALKEQVDSFIHVSSVAALGRSENGEHISEATEWKDSPLNSTYAESKYGAELQVWRGMEEGLNVGVVNPTIILGPGQWLSGSSKFFHTFYNGFPYYTEGSTGFVDVEDVVESLIQVEKQRKFGKRFLITSENVKYKDLFGLITSAYGKKPPHKKPAAWMMNLLWRVEAVRSRLTGANPLVTKETTRSANNTSYYNNKRAVEELGIQFMSIADSVEKNAGLYVQDLEKSR